MHVEYLRVEPPGIPTAFWRSVGRRTMCLLTESSWTNCGGGRSKIRSPIGGRSSTGARAKAVLELAAEKAGWGQPLPDRVGRGVSVQFVFATYLAQVAEVEVSRDGTVRVRASSARSIAGIPVNPDTVQAQIRVAIIFGITAALHADYAEGRPCRANQTSIPTNPAHE